MESNELISKFFPGSTTPLDIEEKQKEQQHESDQWDLKPFIFLVKGKEMQFFPIGALALAMFPLHPGNHAVAQEEQACGQDFQEWSYCGASHLV